MAGEQRRCTAKIPTCARLLVIVLGRCPGGLSRRLLLGYPPSPIPPLRHLPRPSTLLYESWKAGTAQGAAAAVHAALLALAEREEGADAARPTRRVLQLSAALSHVLCHVNRLRRGGDTPARVLCVLASSEPSTQYIPLMNAVFAAQVRRGWRGCLWRGPLTRQPGGAGHGNRVLLLCSGVRVASPRAAPIPQSFPYPHPSLPLTSGTASSWTAASWGAGRPGLRSTPPS